ncbi:hypothetical protein SAMN02745121_03961 [Nannocystis exedens]|uniref:Uncharacterized protein n=1 Tax=Nannocystis exedens TaxID=54 RepID=A0A1I1ZTK8_9BACT|nr:hypothetical protein [Nannocystis exedens]PCC75316.1 hypothetical protein NAEX_08425 [Nannocystis exedens]SFE35134.1 hypothetical protein SAMN02745121_03961 [Nannocystis exedens]
MIRKSPLAATFAALTLTALVGACGDSATESASDGTTTGSTGTTDEPPTGTGTTAPTTTTTGDTSDTTTGPVLPEPDPNVDWPTLECDPLDPNYCLFPFPNNVYTTADATTPTGRRVALPRNSLPMSTGGILPETDVFAELDGFSGGLPGMVHMPGATITGLPGPWSIEISVTPDSPTIILDVDTGELVPHFTELDMSHGDDARRTLLIRPVTRPRDGARLIYAVRNVVDAGGEPLAPSPAFAALRDLTPFPDDPSIDARRPLYADIFQRLEAVGVTRDDLQLAWDYTVSSTENTTGRMLHIRDHALAQVGAAGPAYEIETITEDCAEFIALCVEGEMTVPLYLDKPESGGRMVLDDAGLPTQNGTATYPFTVLIPYSAFEAPSAPVGYGHGLLGSRSQVKASEFRQFAEDYNYILFSVDWVGMAEDDIVTIVGALGGHLHQFAAVPDRGQQGILNFILATRMMLGDFATDPALTYQGEQAMFDTSAAYYFGNSQGGIFGASLMAVQVDVTRGMLGVPGQPYNLLLNRSVDFDSFFSIVKGAYPDPIDIQVVLGLVQMLWDRSEPNGYSHHIREPLPNTPAHDVLLNVAIGDHQVTTLGAHVMARAIGGVVNMGPVNRSIWGIEEVEGSHSGSAMVEFDFGLPPEPTVNVPMKEGDDPHGGPRKLAAANASMDKFFREGVVETFCDGACDPD